jgi:hypothetical protein
VLTPFFGDIGSVSVSKAVLAVAGRPGHALVLTESAVAKALAGRGFRVFLATLSRRVRSRSEYVTIRMGDDLPVRPHSLDLLVLSHQGQLFQNAAQDARAAADQVLRWVRPLAAGGRLILIDRTDGGLLGTRAVPSREDVCAALLAARLRDIAQVTPRTGYVVSHAVVPARPLNSHAS